MKETATLSHDFGARNDPKLIRLQMKMKGEGLGLYWCIVEMLWENGGYLAMDYEAIAFSLRWATPEKVRSVVEDFGLFSNDGEQFWSDSALERITSKEKMKQSRAEAGRRGMNSRYGRETSTPQETPSDGDSAQQSYNKTITPLQQTDNADITFESFNKKEKKEMFFSFSSFEKKVQEEKLLSAFFFFKNVPAPGREMEKFIAFNNSDGRSWDDMTDDARLKAFDAWHQVPERRPRFSDRDLLGWWHLCMALEASGAPQRVRLAALADGVRWEADGDVFRLWCPDVLRDWIESHIQSVGAALMSGMIIPAGCTSLTYLTCKESADLKTAKS